ncbi:uncharacterized protein LOC135131026 isoform X2 [Zophobas morio]|uniref:uncharacterized protein LOC135131026 isoform X2 n=1 Tax=Zophobas morio TaxID=2755281 RepID=UPI003083D647
MEPPNLQAPFPKDTLKTLYLMTFGVMRLRFVKFVLISIFLFHSSIGVVQVIDLLSTFDGKQLLQYGPCFLISCSCLVNIATVLSTQELLSKLFIKLAMSRFRTLERLPLQITRRILFESKMVTLAEIGTLSVLLIYSASYFRLFGNEKFVYGVVLFKRTFTKMADYFCLVYFSTLPILAYVAFINGGVIIYTLMHLRFYMFLINGHLEQIFVDYDLIIDDYAKLKDQNYQEEVFEQLKNCIERHQPIKLIEKKLNAKLLPSLVLLLYLSVAAVISMLFNVLIDHSTFEFFLAVCSMIVSTITPMLVVHIGQIVKNEDVREHSKFSVDYLGLQE